MHPTEMKQQDVEQLATSYSTLKNELENELENARFEIARLREGVLLDEERRRAIEWLGRHHENLTLTADARQTLIDAIMCCGKRELRDKFAAWIPVLIGKVIEAEFNAKVWQGVQKTYGRIFTGRFKGEALSINQIHDFLSGFGFRSNELAVQRKILHEILGQVGHDALVDPENLKKLGAIRDHSTEARHGHCGQKKYAKHSLDQFVKAVELDKETGWIFRFLSLFSQ